MTDTTPTSNGDDVEVLVIGAGPAGLSAALVLGRQQRRVLVVDDGRPRNAPAEHMHMYLTRDGESPGRFRELGRGEIAGHPQVAIESARVSALEAADNGFVATVGPAEDGPARQVRARRVLLASGVRDRLDGLPGLAERWGSDVAHCAYCHGYESRGRRIVVVSAQPVDTMLARYLADRFSKEVTVCTNGHGPDPEVAEAAAAAGVRIVAEPVAALSGPAGAPAVELADGTVLDAEMVFHRPDFEQSNGLAAALECETDVSGLLVVGPTMETSHAGVFAAGDAAVQRGAPAPTAFVAGAVADGQRAAVWIEQQLFLT
ncbi:NAD(P)/FAD-dependent oxidoreductase [Glycomyces sp. L485]|uniref:NAD(P)/FAD-dependent oxidoreductase n=1 Tax=Glycomyces sp. L485 TaxID=2909235 RepID=UPI001F4B56CA|nr:NAD(P)/FAD-dependent oxidoreductase [Glycomyces sp. L485]MCH7231994.1 NAD(P)/FAD-dependent oxidoreductase [Glycomyces sp. L485]